MQFKTLNQTDDGLHNPVCFKNYLNIMIFWDAKSAEAFLKFKYTT